MCIDLTLQPNSYAYQLAPAMPKIREMFYDKSVTYGEMQEFVHNTVSRAPDTSARKKFLENYLPNCINKRAIEELCYNSVKKAKNYDDGK